MFWEWLGDLPENSIKMSVYALNSQLYFILEHTVIHRPEMITDIFLYFLIPENNTPRVGQMYQCGVTSIFVFLVLNKHIDICWSISKSVITRGHIVTRLSNLEKLLV